MSIVRNTFNLQIYFRKKLHKMQFTDKFPDFEEESQALLTPQGPQNSDVPNENYAIPTWDNLSKRYDAKWLEEKDKFHNQLKENFRVLVSQYRSGKQVIFELTDHMYTKYYEQAFRELFSDTGYQATIGDVERLVQGGKKSKKLYVTLPNCFSN